MADKTLDSELFYLIDLWPGYAWPSQGNPVCADGAITGRTDHNVASSGTPIGTKMMVYNKSSVAGADGWSTLVYLKVGTQDAVTAMAAGSICVPSANTALYVVTNDPDANLGFAATPIAIAIGAMTDACYGWFWCGGVCPEGFESDMGGTYPTISTVALGSGMIVANSTGDWIGFDIQNAEGDVPIGITLSDDAA